MLPLYDDERLEDRLRDYGLGRSVRRLVKHPKETPENKDKAARLVSTAAASNSLGATDVWPRR